MDWKSLPIVLKCPLNLRDKQMGSFEKVGEKRRRQKLQLHVEDLLRNNSDTWK